MAPEIIEMTSGGDAAATAADIWSLGCTIIELLTGSPPYYSLGTMQALYKMVQDPHPPLPSNLSQELSAFLKACFVKEYKKRPTASQLLKHPWISMYASLSHLSPSQIQLSIRQHNKKTPTSGLSSINWGNKEEKSKESELEDEIKKLDSEINSLTLQEAELLDQISNTKLMLAQKNKKDDKLLSSFKNKLGRERRLSSRGKYKLSSGEDN